MAQPPARPSNLLLPGLACGAICVLGGVAIALVGKMGRAGPVPNIAFVICGGVLAAFGVRALQSPTSLQVVDVQGADAAGHQRYANARAATAAQGTMAGIVCLLAGIGVAVLGVFFGALLPT
jgi:hypothetical protein